MCFSPSVSRPCGLDSDAETYVFCNRCYAAILGAMAIVDWPELFEADTQQQKQDITDIHEARDGGDRPSRSQDPTQELQHEHNDPVITNHTTTSPPWLLEQYLNVQFVTFAARILGVPLLVPGSSSPPRPVGCNRRRSGASSSSRQDQIRSKYRACVAAFIEASLESAQRCGLLETDGDGREQHHRPRWLVTLPDGGSGSGSGSSDEAQEETVPESAVHAVEAWFATRGWDIGAWNPSPVAAQVGDHVEEGPASQYDNNHDADGGGGVEYRHIYVPAPAAVDDFFSQDPRVPQDPRLLEQLQLEKQRCVVRWAEDEDDHDGL